MDQIKNAFQKVRQDIDSLKEEIDFLKKSLIEINEKISELSKNLRLDEEKTEKKLSFNQNQLFSNPTQTPQNPTHPTHNPTHNLPLKAPNPQNLYISTGNGGVPTDRQTDRQTDQQTENRPLNDALEILNSLDSIKKDIRLKFKRITEQEFLVFSTIYQLSEDHGFVDYKAVSQKLKLTESSIRDYVGKLIKKGIPVEKTKINNKIIQLSISENLKKIAPLAVIMQLRGI